MLCPQLRIFGVFPTSKHTGHSSIFCTVLSDSNSDEDAISYFITVDLA